MENDYLRNADYAISHLVYVSQEKCFFPGGHNGPYLNLESPIRNTSHWVIGFIIAFRLTGDDRYQSAAVACLKWLTDIDCPYYKSSQFLQRQGGTDSCNGVIGDAWVLEALAFAVKWLDHDIVNNVVKLQSAIKERLQLKNNFAFKRFDVTKGYMSCDYTFNHQLWLFMSLIVTKDVKIDFNNVLDFYMRKALVLRKGGLVHHLYHSYAMKNMVNIVNYKRASVQNYNKMASKERGYHLFNLYAFARIKIEIPCHFKEYEEEVKNAFSMVDEAFIQKLFDEKNKYAFNYNSPGFELPLIFLAFPDRISENSVKLSYALHREQTWNEELGAFVNSCDDPMTMTSRAYELGLYLMYSKYGEL